MGEGPRWFKQFPGEHYHLLTAICRLLNPQTIWEFGTDRGMSTVALLEGLRPDGTIYTVDIDAWNTKTGSWLVDNDFSSGRVVQVVSDMKAADLFSQYAESLAKAELIFVDGPKDGVTEAAFLELLERVPFVQNPIVVFDDIRLMNMIYVWRSVRCPKMDMTSYGHWSGTGIVDWVREKTPENVVRTQPKINCFGGDLQCLSARRMNILMLCHRYPNYVPDLLLHGLRKIFDSAVVDYPRKDVLYDGLLGQPFLSKIPDLMSNDSNVDRTDIKEKMMRGFFDIVICDIRAFSDWEHDLYANVCPLAIVDGEDTPAFIKPGNYIILRRETDGKDFSVPLPMALPVEIMNWIDRYANVPKTNSIGFLGSRNKDMLDRNTMLEELVRMFPDALINSWNLDGKWQGRDSYYKALQGCKVVLTLPGAGYDTFRYWENAACNAAHLAKRMPLLIPNDYLDGREIIRFSSIKELAYEIERLLGDDSEWREIAARARTLLLAHHTTERRAQTTIERLCTSFGL